MPLTHYIRFTSLFLFFVCYLNWSAKCQEIKKDDRCNIITTGNQQQFENWLSSIKEVNLLEEDTSTYRIPVVVHIIHTGEPIGEGMNHSVEQIESQIRVLNEDFRRKEGSHGFNTNPVGGDAKIEFVLAKSSPDGGETNGIVRIDINSKEPSPFGGNMVIMGAYFSIWDPYRYLNIWSFPGIKDTGLGQARFPLSDLPGLDDSTELIIPGYDTLNGVAVNDIDGIAINSVHFGESDISSAYNLGRTGTHEVGHFLGLYHIWGDKGFDGSCDRDDYCADTPNTSSRTHGCPTGKKACDGSPAMIENYMDYADDACMNTFTLEQIERMRTVLKNSPRRKSLLTSSGLNPPDGVSAPHQPAVLIKVSPNPYKDKIYIEIPDVESIRDFKLTLYDISGRLLMENTYRTNEGQNFTIDIPERNNKIIILKIMTEQYVTTKKLIRDEN